MQYFILNSTLILIGILGLFVISLMLFSYKSNIFVNVHLVVIFVLCSIRNIIIGLSEITNINPTINSKHISPIYLIVIPSLYLYFKSLVKDYKHIHKKDLIHLFFPILNLGQEYFPALKNHSVQNIQYISLNLFIIVYLVLSFKILYSNLWKEGINRSVEKRHYLIIKNWTLFVFTISSFLFFRIIYSLHTEKMSNELFRAQNYSYLVIIPWFLIYANILINPVILSGYPRLKKRVNEIQDQISDENHVWIFDSDHVPDLQNKSLSTRVKKKVLPYIYDIEKFADKVHPFRNSKFTLSAFAKALNMPSSHMYYIFKYYCIIDFLEYKSYCKIKDALKLIDEGNLDTITLKGLSSKVGFSNYDSFLIAFEKQTKLSPKEYLNL